MHHAASFDVVNAHVAVPTDPVGQWIADRYGVPKVLSVHGGDLYDPSKKLSPRRHFWRRWPIRPPLRRADALVAQSRDTLGIALSGRVLHIIAWLPWQTTEVLSAGSWRPPTDTQPMST